MKLNYYTLKHMCWVSASNIKTVYPRKCTPTQYTPQSLEIGIEHILWVQSGFKKYLCHLFSFDKFTCIFLKNTFHSTTSRVARGCSA